MLYENYKRKIEKVAQILKTIWKYRFIVLSAITVIMLSTGAFLATKGTVSDKIDCPNSIVYGEVLEYKAKGLFSDISYEYSSDSSFKTFSNEMPRMPGKYYVRAVSTGAFKTKRYGEIHSYTIVPKKVDVSIVDNTWTYGDNPAVTADLSYNDTIYCTSFHYNSLATANVTAAPKQEAIKVLSNEGEDVTQAYVFNPVMKNATLTQRNVTITVASADQDYNALPFQYTGYEVTEGNLVALSYGSADTIVATYPSLTDAGSIENDFLTFYAVSANNVDVSHLYNFTIVKGTLTVNKRPVLIDLSSEEETVSFIYDGEEHSYTDYTINADTPLVEGHTETLDSYTTLTDAGVAENLLTFKFFDENEVEVTDNYSVFLSTESYIEIVQRDISVTTPSDEWVYDALTHSNDNFILSASTDTTGLLDGHTHGYSEAIEVTNVSSVENSVTLLVFDADGNDVSENYNVIYTFGTLEVTPRAIEVTTATESWIYDAESHSSTDWEYTNPEASDENKLVSSHSVEATTDVSVLNVADGEIENTVTFDILNSHGVSVTDNYAITYHYGTLKVEPRPVYIVTDSESLVYKAEAYTVTTWHYKAFENGDTTENYHLVSTHTGEATKFNSFTNVSDTAEGNNVFSLLISNEADENVTDNYDLHYEYGTVTIYQREILITTPTLEWVYDGTMYELKEWNYAENSPYQIVSNENVQQAAEIVSYVSLKIPTQEPVLNELILTVVEGETDVTENYDIRYDYGIVKVLKREIHITTPTIEWAYDGITHELTEWSYAEDTPYEIINTDEIQQVPEIVSFTSAKIPTETPLTNELVLKVLFGGEDVSEYYDIRYDYGTVNVLKREVHITTPTLEWAYDGTVYELKEWNYAEDTPYEIINNDTVQHTAEIVSFVTIKEAIVEPILNELVLKILEGEEDVTEYYDIHYDYGTISVLKREIHITTPTLEWIYDGTTYELKEWNYAENTPYQVIDNDDVHHIAVIESFTSRKDFTETPLANELTLKIFDGEEDVTDNYDIHYDYGTVTVLKRELHITTPTFEWVYDATTYELKEWNYAETSPYQVIDNDDVQHTTELVSFISIKNATDGPIVNELVLKILDGEEDVTANYDIHYDYGTVNVLKREIHITTPTLEWVYDGTMYELTEWNYAENTPYQVIDNDDVQQVAEIEAFTSRKDFTENPITNELILKILEGAEDVTANYDIHYDYGTVNVLKRSIYIQTGSLETVYDDTEHSYATWEYVGEIDEETRFALVEWHTWKPVDAPSFKYVTEEENNNVFTLQILDGEEDVSKNYDVHYEYGTISILHRVIYIATASESWPYDDKVHFNLNWTYTAESPYKILGTVEGERIHTFEVVDYPTVQYVTDGEKDNALVLAIFDENKQDVSANYDVQIKDMGKISITSIELTISTASNRWEYDGNPHFDKTFQILSGALLEGHKISVATYTTITEIGEVENHLTYVIMAGEEDRTANYSIIELCGTLTITWHYLEIAPSAAIKEYDRTALTPSDFDILYGTLDEGHYIVLEEIEFLGSQTEIGSSESGIVNGTIKIVDENGNDVTYDYTYALFPGTLTVTKRNITITAGSATKHYDAMPLTCEEYSHDGKLLDGHNLYAETSGSQVEIGSSSNVIIPESVLLYDDYGNDVSNLYNCTFVDGTLTVEVSAVIKVITGSASKEYDNTPLTYDECAYEIVRGAMFPGDYIIMKATGSQTLAGSSPNTVDVDILDKYGKSVLDRYEFEYELGTLTVLKRTVTITTGGAYKVYDGKPLTCSEYNVANLLKGDKATIVVNGSQTEIGKSSNTVLETSFTVYNEKGVNITDCYQAVYDLGWLIVYDKDFEYEEDDSPDINIDTDGDGKPDVNIDMDGDGIPDVNIDTDGDGKADTNIDIDGGGQPDVNVDTDGDGKPDVNIDTNGDGTPEVNLDTNGDGKPDTNIDTDDDGKADTNIDTDGDGTPDTNLDTDGDGKPDTNLDTDGDGTPNLDIDNNGDGIPDTNIDTNGDGKADTNVDVDGDGTPDTNIDTDGDGNPDINVDTNGDGIPDTNIDTDGDGIPDENIGDNSDVNIDTDGDGNPDLNVDTDGDNKPDTNIDTDGDNKADINIDTDGDGQPDLNVDTNGDGEPDVNVDTDGDGNADTNLDTDSDGKADTDLDTDGDGNPDVNIDTDGDGNGDMNLDTNGDGMADTDIDTDGDGNADTNLDTDDDGKSDTNLDTDGDGKADTNLDTDGDGKADSNLDNNGDGNSDTEIDTDGDGNADTNLDTDGDGNADTNVDTDGDGNPNLNIDTDGDGNPDTNLDTDGDGKADTNIDTDGDGIPDLNVDNDGDGEADTNIDTDGDGKPDINVDNDGDGEADTNLDTDGDGEVDSNIDKDGDGEIDTEEDDNKTGGNLDDSGNIGGETIPGGSDYKPTPPSTVLQVKSTTSGAIYLRLMSYGNYTGTGWDAATAYEQYIIENYGFNYLVALALKLSDATQLQKLDVKSFTTDYLLPYFIAMEESNHVIQGNDVAFSGTHNGEYTVYYYAYNGDFSKLNVDLGSLSEVELLYRNFVYSQYLNIDSETNAFIQRIIKQQGWSKDDPKIIYKVQQYVQNCATYNMMYNPDLDKEENMVIAFLGDDYNEGLCRHYASSATMIYRALGIPARYTIGYVGQTVKDQWVDIKSDSGHAWTEVYLDGIGWVPVEVTGAGAGGNVGENEFGGGDNGNVEDDPLGDLDESLLEFEISPLDISKAYDGTPLYAPNEIKVPYNSIIERLTSLGYTYEVVVEGSRTTIGESESHIVSFKLFNPDGINVTDLFTITYLPGKVRVTNTQIVIVLYDIKKEYDGKPISYNPYDYWIKEIPEGYKLEFELQGSITETGEFDIENLRTLPYVVRNEYGEDVTENYYLEIEGVGIRVERKTLEIASASVTREYNGEPLTDDTITILFGSLVDGHTLICKVTGSITDVGVVTNEITSCVITDKDGNDVTMCYGITLTEGILEITDE